MAWDDKIKNLPDARQPFVDMLNEPQTSSELTIMNVPEIVIPADAIVDLALAIREPSTEVPSTATIKVNGILYSEIDNPANLSGYTYWINYIASRVVFPIADAGKRITQLDYQNWGTQHRAQFYIDAYQSLRDIRTVAQKLFNSLEAYPNFQIKVRAQSLTELNTLFPSNQYEGADAYIVNEKKAYRSTGASWIPYEDVTTGDPVPEVVTVSPGRGEVNVALTANVEILFSQNMDGGDITTKFSLVDKNGTPVAGAFTYFDKNGASVTSSSTKIRKMVFNPTSDMTIANSPYSIQLLPSDNILGTPMAATFISDFSCSADMLPTAAQFELVTIRGTSVDIAMVSEGSDYEGTVFYDVYLRNVTAAGTFSAVTGHQGLTAADFPRAIEGLATSTDYEVKVKTRDNGGQTVDSNVLPFKTTGVTDLTPSAPAVNNINILNISKTGYTVQLSTANQPTDPDNPEAIITFDIAEGSTGNILATGVSSADMNAGKALAVAHTEGSSINVYVRAVSSTSGAGSWSTAKNFIIPLTVSTISRTSEGKIAQWNGTDVTQWTKNVLNASQVWSVANGELTVDGAGSGAAGGVFPFTPPDDGKFVAQTEFKVPSTQVNPYASIGVANSQPSAQNDFVVGSAIYYGHNGTALAVDNIAAFESQNLDGTTQDKADLGALDQDVYHGIKYVCDNVANTTTYKVDGATARAGNLYLDELGRGIGIRHGSSFTGKSYARNVCVFKKDSITVGGLPTGWKAKIGTLVATEVSGTATLDCSNLVFPQTTIEVLDTTNTVKATLTPTGGIFGGDQYSCS